ncbi:MAG: MMPL family transporter [Dehalococcoidia bacterium]|nr:MMPL family transporter [Dehalococcoidia bacterium]
MGAWVVVLAVAVGFASQFGNALTTDFAVLTEMEASTGEDLIEERFDDSPSPDEFVILQSDRYTVSDSEFATTATGLVEGIRGHEAAVANVVSFFETQDASLVSEDGRTLLIPVFLIGEAQDLHEVVEPVLEEVHEANGLEGFLAATGGRGSIDRTWIETSERDLQTAELIGLPIALVILVFVFGALVAAGLPILFAFVGILVAVGATAVVGMQFDLSVFVLNMITMIGLAVGIDYTLLVIQRFREERRNGLERDLAIRKTGGTASRAVLFSGMAVVVSLSGLMLVPDTIFRSLATGAILVVLAAVAAALTLLPAMLRLLGDRVNTGTLPGRHVSSGNEGGAFWSRASRAVMGKPVFSVVIAGGLLVALAIPFTGMQKGQSGAATLPPDSDAAVAFRILDEEFNAGVLTPTEIVVEGASDDAAIQSGIAELETLLAGDERFAEMTVSSSIDGQLTRLSTAIAGDSQSDATIGAIEQLREEYLPAAFGETPTYVAGQTAFAIDYESLISQYTPYVFAFVLGLSFVILLVVFRSIVVPIKAIVMNLLSVGAAYGTMVLVFQHGVLADQLGLTQVERIESWVPLMMFAILFGLSMDYHVFLLTRIRERFDQTRDNTGSVAYGVRATAGLITGAAAIMIAVFSGFAMGDLVMMQQFGLGLAVAVFLDATAWSWYRRAWPCWEMRTGTSPAGYSGCRGWTSRGRTRISPRATQQFRLASQRDSLGPCAFCEQALDLSRYEGLFGVDALSQLDVVTHMKTTVEFSDALLNELRRIAEAREGTTLRARIEEGVRTTIARHASKPHKPFKLRDARSTTMKMRPEFEGNWEAIRDEIYRGRGTQPRDTGRYGRISRA